MKTQEQIINEAKEAYESHFEDGKEVTDEAFRGHDVVLDKEELEKEIETKKVEEEKKPVEVKKFNYEDMKPIYSDEELAEIEEQEYEDENNWDDDVDYEEYDEYYDD